MLKTSFKLNQKYIKVERYTNFLSMHKYKIVLVNDLTQTTETISNHCS